MKDINNRSSSKLCLRVCKISVVDKYMQANILAENIAFIFIVIVTHILQFNKIDNQCNKFNREFNKNFFLQQSFQ